MHLFRCIYHHTQTGADLKNRRLRHLFGLYPIPDGKDIPNRLCQSLRRKAQIRTPAHKGTAGGDGTAQPNRQKLQIWVSHCGKQENSPSDNTGRPCVSITGPDAATGRPSLISAWSRQDAHRRPEESSGSVPSAVPGTRQECGRYGTPPPAEEGLRGGEQGSPPP